MTIIDEGAVIVSFIILRYYGHTPLSDALRRFEIYLKELKAWNQKFNLTAIKEDKG